MKKSFFLPTITLVTLLLWGGVSHAGIVSLGAQVQGGSGLDWSSDLGLDYRYSIDPAGAGNYGTGSTTMAHSPSYLVNGESIYNTSYRSEWGLASAQRIDIAPTGGIEGSVHHVHMVNTVPGVGFYGLSAASDVTTNFVFTGGTVGDYTTMYFVYEWRITSDIVGPGADMSFAIYNGAGLNTFQNGVQPQNLSGIFSGSFGLGNCAGGDSLTGSGCNSTQFAFRTVNPSLSSNPGGTSTFDVAFAFSATPIFAVPVAGIPEPEAYAMLLAGLGLLGFAARRRKLKLAAA